MPATLRPSGAVRYRCPVSGSFVLVTDPATLARLAERDTRLRCMDCGEMHLLARDAPAPRNCRQSRKALSFSP